MSLLVRRHEWACRVKAILTTDQPAATDEELKILCGVKRDEADAWNEFITDLRQSIRENIK